MKPIILTLVGKDKPGLIESLAQQVYKFGGNWLASNFSHMAGHFAGFVEIEVPTEQHSALIACFEQHPDLQIQIVTALEKADTAAPLQQATIEILGNDKPGIVQEVSAVFNQFHINIERFASSCDSAPNWGGKLFKATATVTIPDGFELDTLHEALEQIANDLVVDIELKSDT